MAAREPFNVTVRSPAVTTQLSPWHSPVPYLFGGLAAMLGLIAFALLILACSYWKLSGNLENSENDNGERDLEAGEGERKGQESTKSLNVFEEKILVIMAGDANPTFLATPIISSRSSSFGDTTNSTTCSCGNKKTSDHDKSGKWPPIGQTSPLSHDVKSETTSSESENHDDHQYPENNIDQASTHDEKASTEQRHFTN